ncbi:exported protein of unknown function [Candidatus Methylopumilus planktonicus]|uniref:Uncharacterized protein n=1 Tax=Candidatus Methylopumilus planktonicus TaxID=1581557 RepID=A0A0D6EV07_9PROT|nr:hypothetical protein [Candidatus Methylopumilus planktonicus]CEZ19447.1 exported protein of unknown function [Candidatus Methylopumilus planktonicus]
MARKITILIGVIGILLAAYFRANFTAGDDRGAAGPRTFLQEKGDMCTGVAENAVANREAIVEFQKYEILSDKILIMERCMDENGFEVHSQWSNQMKSVIQIKATTEKISEEEAEETLRRKAMFDFFSKEQKVTYWQAKKK